MNEGKLKVIKWEMTRVNIDILRISELKWTRMGEFNSDDHCIYYCGQESLRRNGVVIKSSQQKSSKCSKISKVTQSCPTLCDPLDCSLLGSSTHGIFLARVLEWVAISFCRRSSQPRDWTRVSRIAGRRFTLWATGEAPVLARPYTNFYQTHSHNIHLKVTGLARRFLLRRNISLSKSHCYID